jgi:hypothetical protein
MSNFVWHIFCVCGKNIFFKEFFMNNQMVRIAAVLFAALFSASSFLLLGCGSLMPASAGIVDRSVPIEQQCTIRAGWHVTIGKFDGEDVAWSGVASVPAGTHGIMIYYSERVDHGNSSYTTYNGSLSLLYEFLPGHNYIVQATRNNTIFEAYIEENTTKYYHGGTFITVVDTSSFGVNKNPFSLIGIDVGSKAGVLFDNGKLSTGLLAETTAFVGFFPVDLGFSIGLNAAMYEPFPLSIGGGLIYQFHFTWPPESVTPYLRLGFPIKTGEGLPFPYFELYLDYYFPSSPLSGNAEIIRDDWSFFGIGARLIIDLDVL